MASKEWIILDCIHGQNCTYCMYAMSVMPTHTHRNTCRKINLITAYSCRPKVEKFRAVIKPQPHQLCTRNSKQSGRGVTVHSPCPGGTVGTRLLWGEWQETPLLVTTAGLWLSWKKHEYDSPFPNTGSPETDRDTWGEDRTLQIAVHVARAVTQELQNLTLGPALCMAACVKQNERQTLHPCAE